MNLKWIFRRKIDAGGMMGNICGTNIESLKQIIPEDKDVALVLIAS